MNDNCHLELKEEELTMQKEVKNKYKNIKFKVNNASNMEIKSSHIIDLNNENIQLNKKRILFKCTNLSNKTNLTENANDIHVKNKHKDKNISSDNYSNGDITKKYNKDRSYIKKVNLRVKNSPNIVEKLFNIKKKMNRKHNNSFCNNEEKHRPIGKHKNNKIKFHKFCKKANNVNSLNTSYIYKGIKVII